MKKTFKLKATNKHTDRVVEGIKNEVRKYIKREKRKALPEEMNFWFFDCKFALEGEEPQVIDFTEIIKCIDEAHKKECETFYLEIIARAGFKESKKENDETFEEQIDEEEAN